MRQHQSSAGLSSAAARDSTPGEPNRRLEDQTAPLLHATPSGAAEGAAASLPLEWKAYELQQDGDPRSRPVNRILEDTQGGTLLLDLGGPHALLIAGSAIRRIPRGTDRNELLIRAAAGASAWEKEQLRLWRRSRLPDQLAELSGQLNRAGTPEAIAKLLTEHAIRVVGGYRAFLLLRDREEGPGSALTGRLSDAMDARVTARMHPRLAAPGIISAFEARPDLGMPFSELAPIFEDTSAVVLIHTPVGEEGVLLLAERRRSRLVEPEDFTLMKNLSHLAEGALLRVFSVDDAHRLSLVDPLTGLANRRHMQVLMRHVWASARRGKRFSVILMDLDNFKEVNDTLGHLMGDRLLRKVAEVLQEEVRGSDLVVRFGGDEFLIVLPEEGAEGASALIRRVHGRLSGTIDFSAGIAEYHPDLATVEEMLDLADRQLYVVKRRDRIRGSSGD